MILTRRIIVFTRISIGGRALPALSTDATLLRGQKRQPKEAGYALWEPSPGDLYDVASVGDVGYISQGRFNRLFNILLPADDPSHENFGVPEYHEQFQPKVPRHLISDPGEVVFSCTENPGAVLSLPIEAKQENTVVREDFGKWMIKHIDQWFAWTQGLGLEINKMEDIVLLTGTDRTKSWANVAFLGGQADARVSFGVEATHTETHTKINWQFSPERKTGATVWHRGPSGENLPEDQCIFIRGFRVRKRMIWWHKLRAAAGPNPDPKDDDSEPEATLISIPTVPKVWYSFRVSSHLLKLLKYRDPLHVMLEYIAEERPNCDMAIVHDDDLALLDVLGDGSSLEALQTEVVLSSLRSSSLSIHEVELSPASTRKIYCL
ncbi:hypothetical protein EI94DRAFT_1703308 [Lactarius quietus]|nr:hypothetical protein EI94DRAFT_1703308 [Lactarius quietus]